MAETAYQTQYRREFIAGFEQRQSLLRDAVTTEIELKGNTATFLIADSGDAEAVTRGVNGMIPARGDDLTQTSATLVEWHDLVRRTKFNIFASQGDGRRIMQMTTMGVINRKIDQDIITQLNTGTVTAGATAIAGTPALMLRAKTILGVNKVPFDGNITALITPALEAYLLQAREFAGAEYVNARPLADASLAWSDVQKIYRWAGMNIIVHPELPGVGTSAEKCFVFHRTAIGHAVSPETIQTAVGYDDEQDYSYARCSVYMGSKLLQNSGVVVVNHDGSALAAG